MGMAKSRVLVHPTVTVCSAVTKPRQGNTTGIAASKLRVTAGS